MPTTTALHLFEGGVWFGLGLYDLGVIVLPSVGTAYDALHQGLHGPAGHREVLSPSASAPHPGRQRCPHHVQIELLASLITIFAVPDLFLHL